MTAYNPDPPLDTVPYPGCTWCAEGQPHPPRFRESMVDTKAMLAREHPFEHFVVQATKAVLWGAGGLMALLGLLVIGAGWSAQRAWATLMICGLLVYALRTQCQHTKAQHEEAANCRNTHSGLYWEAYLARLYPRRFPEKHP